MEFREHPLLNTPNMSVVILKAARTGFATVDSCAERLNALLAETGEHPPISGEELRRRLELLIGYLAEARLLTGNGEGGFALTPRGEAALREHPLGFTRADLMTYPEFTRYVHEVARNRADADTRTAAHDAGFAAYRSGALPSDNPHAADTADHFAWESGWFEAFDADASRP